MPYYTQELAHQQEKQKEQELKEEECILSYLQHSPIAETSKVIAYCTSIDIQKTKNALKRLKKQNRAFCKGTKNGKWYAVPDKYITPSTSKEPYAI
jgi:predicted HTH transcriptional regulator